MREIALGGDPVRPGRTRPSSNGQGPRAFMWSRYQPVKQIDFNGHFWQADMARQGVLVDPVPFNEGDEDHVAHLGGPVAVILTNADHARDAVAVADRFGCPLLVPTADLAAAGIGRATAYEPGALLPGDLLAVAVPGNKTPGETALYHAASATLLVGDAVIGSPAGRLSLLPEEKYADPVGAARGLRVLLSRPLRNLLLGDGHSPVSDPVAALQALIYDHYPEAFLLRRDDVHWEAPWTHGERFGGASAEYSRLLGLQTMDFDLNLVPPGKQSVPLHRHDGEEEVFVVLAGRGEVLTDRGNFPIAAGDILGFPPRFQIAHAFRNNGSEDLVFLAFAAAAETLEMVDYPDTGKRMEVTPYGKRLRFYLPEKMVVPYWEGERAD